MDNSKEFACKRCGNCCVITASITPEENDRIERFLKKNKDIQEITYKNYSITINLIELLNTLDDKCFFYDRANGLASFFFGKSDHLTIFLNRINDF